MTASDNITYIEKNYVTFKKKYQKGNMKLPVEDSPGKLTINQVKNYLQNEITVSSMHDWLIA